MHRWTAGLGFVVLCGCTEPARNTSSACTAAAASTPFAITPREPNIVAGFDFQMTAMGPAACFPAHFEVTGPDTLVLSTSGDGRIRGLRAGTARLRVLSADPLVRDSTTVRVTALSGPAGP